MPERDHSLHSCQRQWTACCQALPRTAWRMALCTAALLLCGAVPLAAQSTTDPAAAETVASNSGRRAEAVQRFTCEEAFQGVAVDREHFYAIANRRVGKYEKATGKRVAQWEDAQGGPLKHLNAAVVVEGKLYGAHSTYPSEPRLSSVEIWDAATLEHIGSHSFGEYGGALNWVDWHEGHWWAVFAYYGRTEGPDHVRRTTLVKFDRQWRRLAAWVFPPEVLERFAPSSNSGGNWGPDGLLYCTGHDHQEMYALRIPQSGSVLELVETVPVPFAGQAFVWDRTQDGMLYGIVRRSREVVAARMVDGRD